MERSATLCRDHRLRRWLGIVCLWRRPCGGHFAVPARPKDVSTRRHTSRSWAAFVRGRPRIEATTSAHPLCQLALVTPTASPAPTYHIRHWVVWGSPGNMPPQECTCLQTCPRSEREPNTSSRLQRTAFAPLRHTSIRPQVFQTHIDGRAAATEPLAVSEPHTNGSLFHGQNNSCGAAVHVRRNP